MKSLKEMWNGEYYEHDGCEHDDPTNLIQCGLLNFCGCGSPEENLKYILTGLELINEKPPASGPEWREWYADTTKRRLEHFGNQQAEYFFYYWCDERGYTEHGSSVPGWLDKDGLELLALLREWKAATEAE